MDDGGAPMLVSRTFQIGTFENLGAAWLSETCLCGMSGSLDYSRMFGARARRRGIVGNFCNLTRKKHVLCVCVCAIWSYFISEFAEHH